MIIQKEQVDISKIKLIIWDLDNTFWKGTMTEGGCEQIPEHAELIKELSQRGIVNSICSKNNFEDCEKLLRKVGMWDWFVFPSIEWTPKGRRVTQIISDMNLRPANVLFLDDEPANLQAAEMEAPALMCSTAQEVVSVLRSQCQNLKVDLSCSRLQRYKELQKKTEVRKEFNSDQEFLRLSQIRVSISNDCTQQFDRVLELINRTNQLNFTKIRLEADELQALLQDRNIVCGYISCRDKFSNYGIVGFYAMDSRKHSLLHYLFSCRTIGMGVEQFVYAWLDYPALCVSGDVVTQLNDYQKPDWITLEKESREKRKATGKGKPHIIVKGPCDVSQVIPFFSDGAKFYPEFAYVSNTKKGTYIEGHNHTSQIIRAMDGETKQNLWLQETIPFIDSDFYKTKLFSQHFDYFIFSVLTDYSLGLYRNRENPELVIPFGQYTTDYTQKENWELVRSIFGTEKEEQKRRQYEQFCDTFESIGPISDEDFISNLTQIREKLPQDTVMIFLNGAERPYLDPNERWVDRDQVHVHRNALLEQFVREHADNCTIIDVNSCMGNDAMPYLDTINHYKKNVYYNIAIAIQNYIQSNNPRFRLTTDENQRQHHSFLSRIRRRLKGICHRK